MNNLRRVGGDKNPLTLKTWATLAKVEWKRGKLADAENDYREVLDKMAKALRPQDPAFLSARAGFAGTREALGHHAEAEAEYRKILAVREKSLGPTHPDVGDLLLRIGLCQFAEKKVTKETLSYARRAEAIFAGAFGPGSEPARTSAQLRVNAEAALAHPSSVDAVKR